MSASSDNSFCREIFSAFAFLFNMLVVTFRCPTPSGGQGCKTFLLINHQIPVFDEQQTSPRSKKK
jgi:hypothetical protein